MTEINISFKVENEYNELTSAFGIEDEYQIDIVKKFKPKIKDNQNLFITGESGSGKSLLLKRFGKIIDIALIPKEPLIKWPELFNIEQKYFCQLLSGVGLCDAKLFTRSVDTFSDSQRYRSLLLYSLINYDTIILDEFLSTIDRGSAGPIAFAFQKICKKIGKRYIVATAHSDICEYLKPDVVWTGEAYTGVWKEEDFDFDDTYPDDVVLEEKDVKDVRKHYLLNFHYATNLPSMLSESSIIKINDREIGIIIIGNDIFKRGMKYIRRIVIHPSYRGCGFSKILIDKYIKIIPKLRVLSKIVNFNDLFSNFGNTELYIIKAPKLIKDFLIDKNFNINSLSSCQNLCLNEDVRVFLHDNYKKSWGTVINKDTVKLPERILYSNKIAGSIIYNLRDRTTPRIVLS